MEKNLRKRAWLRKVIWFLFKFLSHVHVNGLKNIPREGGAILASNHLGRLDAPLGFCLLERQDATSLVADKYKKSLFFRWIVDATGGIWINREDADLQAMRAARDLLKQGGLLGIAPEGTRSRNGKLGPAKTGVAYLADKVDVPIIPIAIHGTEKAFQELFRFRRPHLYVHFGEPFFLSPLDRKDREAGMQRNTDEIMCRIAAMLPQNYRGVYEKHPRLGELLTESSEKESSFVTTP